MVSSEKENSYQYSLLVTHPVVKIIMTTGVVREMRCNYIFCVKHLTSHILFLQATNVSKC